MASFRRPFALPALAVALAGCPAFLSDDFRAQSDAGMATDGTVTESFSDATSESSLSDGTLQEVDAQADAGGDGGGCADGNDAGACGACQDGAIRCSFNGVQTCANGAWGSVIACPSTTPDCDNGVCGQPTSCQVSAPGTTDCGSAAESCCASLEVPGDQYDRTYTNDGSGPMGEADPATITGLRLDKYLVTVGRFRQFVAAWNNGSGYLPPAGAGKHVHVNDGKGLAATGGGYEAGWDATDWNNTTDVNPTNANLVCEPPSNTWTATAGSQETLPMGCVNWYEAYAFCIWDGGFLPSEAEWEYAAAGGSQQREYPWGSTAPGATDQYAIYGGYFAGNSTGVAPVGSAALGAGLWGQFDLAGEVYEWNLDYFATYVDPCADCAYLVAGSSRVGRGGDVGNPASSLLPASRNSYTPSARYALIGFRCARTP